MERIVITPLMGMGDTLMTTPALKLLKESRPDCEVTFFTFNRATRDVLLNNPHIDHLWHYPIKAINFIPATLHVLVHFTFRFDTCLNFYPSNRIQYNVFSFMTGAKKRVGHSYLKMNVSQMNWLKNRTIPEKFTRHCVEENCKLLSFFEIEPDLQAIPPMKMYLTDEEKEKGRLFVKKYAARPLAGIHAGTSTFKNHTHRRWPKERFVEMIDRLSDVHFFLFGALDEVTINRDIQSSVKNSGQVTVVEGMTLREVAAIIGELDLFISNDSGLMHIGAAMNTPVVEILGPTNPHFIYPWGVRHKVVRLDLPCSPCFYYSPKPLSCVLDEPYKCLRQLNTSLVVNACRELLG